MKRYLLFILVLVLLDEGLQYIAHLYAPYSLSENFALVYHESTVSGFTTFLGVPNWLINTAGTIAHLWLAWLLYKWYPGRVSAKWVLVLFYASALGNLIDLIFKGFVADIFYLRSLGVVFNLADVYGPMAFLLLIYVAAKYEVVR